jgi:hypothetical protein
LTSRQNDVVFAKGIHRFVPSAASKIQHFKLWREFFTLLDPVEDKALGGNDEAWDAALL